MAEAISFYLYSLVRNVHIRQLGTNKKDVIPSKTSSKLTVYVSRIFLPLRVTDVSHPQALESQKTVGTRLV